jgi:DNA-directed RNA polymerase beta subunit
MRTYINDDAFSRGEYMKRIATVICAYALTLGAVYAQQSKAKVLNTLPVDSMIEQAVGMAPLEAKYFMIVKKEVIPYPASWASLTAAEKQLKLFNILNRLSTQSGISFKYKASGIVTKEIITDSYYTNSFGESEHEAEHENDDNSKQAEAQEKQNKKHHEKENSNDETKHNGEEEQQIPDPVCTELPDRVERLAEQDDSLFGDQAYRHIFTNTENETLLTATNFKSLKYFGMFTCAKKYEYTMYTSVMQSADGIVLSSVTTVNNHDSKKRILFWNVDLADAFSRRTDALFTWYKNQLSLEK